MRKIEFGADPQFNGPRDYFRNSLIIRKILKRIGKVKILDFGCGTGNLLIRLGKKGYTVCGIDTSKLSVEYLKKKIRRENLDKFLHVNMGTEDLLFNIKNKFDVVVCGEVLEHLKNDQKAVQGFYQVLKKGGICIITAPAHKFYWGFNDEVSGHIRRYEKKELVKLFEDQGFIVEEAFYWGLPLGLFWEKFIYLPVERRKLQYKITYSGNNGLISRFLQLSLLKKILSYLFYFDYLFNWTNLGNHLFLIVKK